MVAMAYELQDSEREDCEEEGLDYSVGDEEIDAAVVPKARLLLVPVAISWLVSDIRSLQYGGLCTEPNSPADEEDGEEDIEKQEGDLATLWREGASSRWFYRIHCGWKSIKKISEWAA